MNERPSPRRSARVPRIGDLIDLELAFEEDRERPIEALLARDARMGREIDAAHRDDRSLLLLWLDRVRPSPESPGLAVEGLLRLLSALLIAAGLVSGALGVAGWLWSGAGAPVNVVQLWPALVGVQLALAVSFVVVRLTSAWIVERIGDGLSTWLPAALGALFARLSSPTLREAWSRFRALDRVYGGLRFWRVTRLSQSFAVAFNVGALAALFFIPTVDDPAFGWRSRLMDAAELHAVATVVAAPWAALWPEALPTRAEVEATEDSSLRPTGPRVADPSDSPVWAAWWPFLAASFAVYGLLPRLALHGIAGLRTRSLLRGIAFDHASCVRVRERLRRSVVDGRALGDETPGVLREGHEPPVERLELPGRLRVVRWAGVPLDDARLSDRVAAAFGVVVDRVVVAGGLDLAGDADALAALRDAAAGLVVVEAWEAPSVDYLDFLQKLRRTLGERVPLLVLPCEVGVDGRPTAVQARHLSLWRRGLAGLADPWLRVEAFPVERAV